MADRKGNPLSGAFITVEAVGSETPDFRKATIRMRFEGPEAAERANTALRYLAGLHEAALRAQPQARDDAQPVAWLVGKGAGTIMTRGAAWAAGKRAQGVSVTPLYTHPAANALREALRRAEYVLTSVQRESSDSWLVHDAGVALGALAGLQAREDTQQISTGRERSDG